VPRMQRPAVIGLNKRPGLPWLPGLGEVAFDVTDRALNLAGVFDKNFVAEVACPDGVILKTRR